MLPLADHNGLFRDPLDLLSKLGLSWGCRVVHDLDLVPYYSCESLTPISSKKTIVLEVAAVWPEAQYERKSMLQES